MAKLLRELKTLTESMGSVPSVLGPLDCGSTCTYAV